MSTDQNIQERAEKEYPIDGYMTEVDKYIVYSKRHGYIKGASEERELMSNQWVSEIDKALKDCERVRNQYRRYKEGTNGAGIYNGLSHAIGLLKKLLPPPVIKKG